jgi:hypothetical protein
VKPKALNPAFAATAVRLVKCVSFRDLIWRWHGLGMLQAELDEEVRVHVWHESLRKIPRGNPRCIHDHRFRIDSAVVVGCIVDHPYIVLIGEQPFLQTGGEFFKTDAFEIRHAKAQTGADDAVELGDAWAKETPGVRHAAGSTYVIRRRDWHTTHVEELTVTVVFRSEFDDKPARVLGHSKTGIVADKLTWASMSTECHDVLTQAHRAVRR